MVKAPKTCVQRIQKPHFLGGLHLPAQQSFDADSLPTLGANTFRTTAVFPQLRLRHLQRCYGSGRIQLRGMRPRDGKHLPSSQGIGSVHMPEIDKIVCIRLLWVSVFAGVTLSFD